MRRLTDNNVVAILLDERRDREIANEYGVRENTICRIKNGTRWGHIAPEIPRLYRYTRAESLAEFILKKIDTPKKGECWIWKGYTNGVGYGDLRFKNQHMLAHRASYEAFVGKIPEGMLLMHSCDNPICCNPEHLKVGTDQDNKNDCVAKGRHSRGEKHLNSILKAIAKRFTNFTVRSINP